MNNITSSATSRATTILAIITIAAVLALAAVMTVSAQSDTPDWRLPATGLTVLAGDEPGEMLITWDAHTQTTKTLLNYRVAWTPEGESFKKVSVSFTDDVYTETVTNKATAVVVTPPNVAPTGLPTITGTAEAR